MDAKQLEGELRRFAELNFDDGIDTPLEAIAQAADELERLSAENAELREKFEHITTFRVDLPQETKDKIEQIVYDAVEQEAGPYLRKFEAYERVFAKVAKALEAKPMYCGSLDSLDGQNYAYEHVLRMAREAGWEG